jgi:hypothetical protein
MENNNINVVPDCDPVNVDTSPGYVPMTEEEIAEIKALDERYNQPPCLECGAKTRIEAGLLCKCAGDKDSCHGCHLWPD